MYALPGERKSYVKEVVICTGSEDIARHRCSYGREELIFQPLQYLALRERKIGALEQAAPLDDWRLPDIGRDHALEVERRHAPAGLIPFSRRSLDQQAEWKLIEPVRGERAWIWARRRRL